MLSHQQHQMRAAWTMVKMGGHSLLRNGPIAPLLPRTFMTFPAPLFANFTTTTVSAMYTTTPPITSASVSQKSAEEEQPLGPKTKQALSLLHSTTGPAGLYAIVEMKGRPYHVASGDVLVTMKLKGTALGDVITFDRIREVGNADMAWQGAPFLPPSLVRVEGTVIEHPISRQRVTREVNKRIKGRTRVLTGETHHTSLRIREIRIASS